MSLVRKRIFSTHTEYAEYQVWDLQYGGRPARVLYSGNMQAAQSGIPKDDNPDLLFDYNQRFYELVSAVLPDRLLLIGGGMYTLPMALLSALPSLFIDVVEIDAGLDGIAAQYFDFKPHPRLQIIHTDGRSYLNQNRQDYDMILVDAFSHAHIPSSLTSGDAAWQIKQNLTSNGLIAANVIATVQGEGSDILTNHTAAYESVFGKIDIFPASQALALRLPQNLILVGHAGTRFPVNEYLRYPSFEDLQS